MCRSDHLRRPGRARARAPAGGGGTRRGDDDSWRPELGATLRDTRSRVELRDLQELESVQ